MSAWISHGLGLITLLAVLIAWVGVQRAFRRAFPDPCGDPDALSGRTACDPGPCFDNDSCPRRRDTSPTLQAEEIA